MLTKMVNCDVRVLFKTSGSVRHFYDWYMDKKKSFGIGYQYHMWNGFQETSINNYMQTNKRINNMDDSDGIDFSLGETYIA